VATLFTHAVVGGALASLAPAGVPRGRAALAFAAAAVLPDLDVVGFHLGLPYGHALGHRGMSHSLLFAAAAGAALALALPAARRTRAAAARMACLGALACASHGLLDAATDGGRGVAFLLPFDAGRTFLPWRPLPVSPLEPAAFLGARGLRILAVEIALVWLPLALLLAGRRLAAGPRRSAAPRASAPPGSPAPPARCVPRGSPTSRRARTPDRRGSASPARAPAPAPAGAPPRAGRPRAARCSGCSG